MAMIADDPERLVRKRKRRIAAVAASLRQSQRQRLNLRPPSALAEWSEDPKKHLKSGVTLVSVLALAVLLIQSHSIRAWIRR